VVTGLGLLLHSLAEKHMLGMLWSHVSLFSRQAPWQDSSTGMHSEIDSLRSRALNKCKVHQVRPIEIVTAFLAHFQRPEAHWPKHSSERLMHDDWQ
jgi:hypothetical protein